MKGLRISLILLLVCAITFVTAISVTRAALTPEEEWFKQAAAPYRGITLRGVTESTSPSMAIADIIDEFEELTGINVDYTLTSWGEMYAKEISDMVRGAGIYDFIYIEQDIVFSYMEKGWLTDLTELMEKRPDLVYPELDLDDFLGFIDYFKDERGHLYGLIMESFLKTYCYRKDLFAHPEIREAFKTKYGWDLRPAVNWEEYEQIAEFFFKDAPKILGFPIYGHSAQVKGVTLPYTFVETWWPSHGVWNWGIDMEVMRAETEEATKKRAEAGLPPPPTPLMDSPESAKALARFIKLLGYAPPGVMTYTWEGAAGAIATEKAVQGLVYGDQLAWVATDPARSAVIGKVRCTLPPTEPGVMEAAEKGIGYIGYYDGGAFGIPYSSKNKEAAWLLIQYITRKEGARYIAEKGFAPIRKSILEEMVGSPIDVETGYFTLMKEKSHLFRGAPPFPFHKVLIEGPLMKWLHKAVIGEVDPETAVKEMAAEVDYNLYLLGY